VLARDPVFRLTLSRGGLTLVLDTVTLSASERFSP